PRTGPPLRAPHYEVEIFLKQVVNIDCNKCKAELDVSECDPFDVIECPECGAELPVPGMIGEYILFKELGTGRVGTVFQGFDQTLLRHVALKVMNRRFREDEEFVESFMMQARAMASLNHENVVKVYTCGKDEDQPYVVMELIEGGRLSDRMKGGRGLDEMMVLKVARDIVNGLNAAHEIGLLHGDVKPENILIDKKGVAKITDFSVVHDAGESGEIWGTPNYMAPEKVRRQVEDQRSDFYSLGATLFHALTSEAPFQGETPKDVVLARLKEPAPALDEVRDDLNPGTVRLVARMLEMEPIRRYPNPQSMAADIKKAMQESQSLSQKSRSKFQPGGQKKKRKPLVAWVVILLLLGGWAGAWFWAHGKAKTAGLGVGEYITQKFNHWWHDEPMEPKPRPPATKAGPQPRPPAAEHQNNKPRRMSFDELEAVTKEKKKKQ
ncbi:MAG: serine/threonine-protein kinase, partial [Verrucomicrobiota bacterium]